MANLGNIDRDVEVNNGGGGSFTLLADDSYQLEITESEVAATASGKGQKLDLKVQVADGPHKGVHFFHSINIQHESAQAQAIGQGQLRALCEAAGVDFATLSDSETLHFRPFWAQVGNETYFSKKHNRDLTKNVIEKFLWEGMPEDTSPPKSKASPTPPAQPSTPPASAGKARPWSPK